MELSDRNKDRIILNDALQVEFDTSLTKNLPPNGIYNPTQIQFLPLPADATLHQHQPSDCPKLEKTSTFVNGVEMILPNKSNHSMDFSVDDVQEPQDIAILKVESEENHKVTLTWTERLKSKFCQELNFWLLGMLLSFTLFAIFYILASNL
ncbi:hypothetical protein BC833DRAFT_621075 [Globomyces pollinis-pini]|nr:hypothetical protein BC833DRAFT_621075 [Globomyces pollinis-pini]